MFKIGVTGTRSGMDNLQFFEVYAFLSQHEGELHHGDCVGVDHEVAIIAETLGYKIICHPPENDKLRVNHDSHEIRKPLSYFVRNRNIVDETDILLVIPYQREHQSNGGTWYTHDYALKKNKPVNLILPDRGLS